jgi:hypothetical protein
VTRRLARSIAVTAIPYSAVTPCSRQKLSGRKYSVSAGGRSVRNFFESGGRWYGA